MGVFPGLMLCKKGLRYNTKYYMRFQVLTAASMKMRAVWDIAQRSLYIDGIRRQ
jgi:hypothetical protein